MAIRRSVKAKPRSNGEVGDPRTRQLLSKSGRAVFARKGYVSATVDDIIRRAKVSRGTFYVYFRNKEDAFEKIIADVIDEMFSDAYKVRSLGASNFDAIKQANANYINSFMNHLDVMAVLYQADTLNAEVARIHHQYRQKFLDRVRHNLERNLRQRADRRLDPSIAATGLGLMVEYFAYLWLGAKQFEMDNGFTVDEVVETLSVLWYRAVYAEDPPGAPSSASHAGATDGVTR
jgi:AcrR family transcriptional regulator